MEKLEYLKKYSSDIILVAYNDLPVQIQNEFPKYWVDLLAVGSAELRKTIVLNEWSKFSYQFQSTLQYLQSNLVDVELIFHKNKYALLYSIKNKAGSLVFYEGGNTYAKDVPLNIRQVWDKIPATFTDFYDQLHNGWVYYASQSNGVLPIEDVIILGDLDWGFLETIDLASLPFRLENCIGFFNNGMGDYACIDLNSEDEKQGFIWWNTKPPKLNVEIWPIIDEWTKIGIEK